MNQLPNNNGEIIIYQTEDGLTKINVNIQGETVWLSLDLMAELFQRDKSTISRHIKNIFSEGELDKEVVVAKYATTTQHGAIEGKQQTHWVDYYNLDVIISVGYRVKSVRGTQFRIWAPNKRGKVHMMNRKFPHEQFVRNWDNDSSETYVRALTDEIFFYLIGV